MLKSLDVDESQFELRDNAGAVYSDLDISNAYVSGDELHLQLSRELKTDDIPLSFAYNANNLADFEGKISDLDGNFKTYFAGSLHGSDSIQIGWGNDTTPTEPTSIHASTNGEITLYFNQSIDAAKIENAPGFQDGNVKDNFLITIGGSQQYYGPNIQAVAPVNTDEWGNSYEIKITLDSPIPEGSTVEVLYGGSYLDKHSAVIQNRFGSDFPSFTSNTTASLDQPEAQK